MIGGLPLESWILLVVSVGLGLAIELKFFFTHRRGRRQSHKPTGTSSEGDAGS